MLQNLTFVFFCYIPDIIEYGSFCNLVLLSHLLASIILYSSQLSS